MNISSWILATKPENIDTIIAFVNSFEGCEYHLHKENGTIIITVESEDADKETGIVSKIRRNPMITSISLAYTYCGDEIEVKNTALQKEADMPEWLNKEDVDVKKIKYSGDLKRKNL